MKKTFKKLTAIAMTAFVCLSFGSTALAVDVNEIEDAITAGDTETVEKLIRIDESNKVKETVDAVVSLDEESEPIIREDFPAMLGIQYEAGAGEGLLVDSNANIHLHYQKQSDFPYFRHNRCRPTAAEQSTAPPKFFAISYTFPHNNQLTCL